jgi:hypothetical protein
MGIIIFYIIIMRLIEYTIWIVIAIWILISYSSCLTDLRALIHSHSLRPTNSIRSHYSISSCAISIRSLTSYKQNSFMEATDNWNFRLLLLSLLLSVLSIWGRIPCCRLWLLHWLRILLRRLIVCACMSLLLLGIVVLILWR